MKKRMSGLKKTVLILLLAFLLCLTAGCAKHKSAEAITSAAQLNEAGRKIGVASDTAEDRLVAQEFPQATVEYYKDEMLAYTSVRQGKLDAFVFSASSMENAIYNGLKGVRLLDESIGEGNTGAVAISPVSKIPDLEGKVNAFLNEIRSDGTMEDAENRWLKSHDETMPEIPSAAPSGLRLVVGTTGSNMPFTYYKGTELAGYDIELARRFAAWLGAELQFKVYDYDGIIPAAVSGDVDCIFANLFITPERAEAIRFSEPTYVSRIGIMVRDTGAEISAKAGPEITDYAGLSGKTVSMLTGAPFEELVRSKNPDVAEFSFFNNMPDMLLALKSGKTDAVLINNAIAALSDNRDPELSLFPQNLQDGKFGFAFAKGDPRRDAWQAARDAIPEDQIQAAWDKWTGADERVKTLPEQDWPGENGTVRVAACDTLEPMSYAGQGGELIGFDLEVILMVARELDIRVEFTGMEFSAILSSVQSGKADIGTGSIIITDERAESVDFVEYYPAAFVLIVRAVQGDTAYRSLADFGGKRIGVLTGAIQGPAIEKQIPTAELCYYNATPDLLVAARADKIDAFSIAEPITRYLMLEHDDLTYLDEPLTEIMVTGAVFPKTEAGAALRSEFNAFLAEARDAGVLDEIDRIWIGKDESLKTVPDISGLSGENGTLVLATDATMTPYSYVKDGTNVGMDIDLILRFCKARGYGLEIKDVSFSGLIDTVVTGKCDFAVGAIAHTEERAESVDFSDPVFQTYSVIAYLKTETDSFGASSGSEETSEARNGLDIVESFNKTFVREDRWKLFVDGVLTTLLITVLSILFGTALGFVVYMLCRNGNAVANAITRFSVWLVQGMPMVVLLMILYYIIFGSVSVSGLLVAVIGFTLTFGSAVFGLLKMGVGTIDRGQYEAAYALGYSNRRTFFRVILPQAVPLILPAYKGEIVSLIKATAIVGYIAVQDLTKMCDLVRSRTYEAFFPLIAITVIYFALEWLLGFLVGRIQIRTNPKKRKPERILKGVSIHD